MHIFSLIRLVRRAFLMTIVDGEGGGGGVIDTPVIEQPAAPVAGEPAGAAPAAPEAPKTMLEAISQGLDAQREPGAQPDGSQPGQPRDPQGRFAPKPGEQQQSGVAKNQGEFPPNGVRGVAPGQQPAQPAKPDDLAMPEGLAPDSQRRFQQLANEVRELRPLRERADQLDRQVSYVRDTFQTHGIRQEQFEQAAGFIGMLNKGDLEGASRFLQQQLQQIALVSGKPVGAVDALADYPDLRQAVDGMQITEQHALELARGRMQQHHVQQHTERQKQEQQTQDQQRQAFDGGMRAVDAWCKQMAASDVDFPAIEAQLLPQIKNLIEGIPPTAWTRVIETNYRLMKQAATAARQNVQPSGGNALRPTGAASPQQAPKTMAEAMWGKNLAA